MAEREGFFSAFSIQRFAVRFQWVAVVALNFTYFIGLFRIGKPSKLAEQPYSTPTRSRPMKSLVTEW